MASLGFKGSVNYNPLQKVAKTISSAFRLTHDIVTARQHCSPSRLFTKLSSFGCCRTRPAWLVQGGADVLPFWLENNEGSHTKNTLEICTQCSSSGLIRRRCSCYRGSSTRPYSLNASYSDALFISPLCFRQHPKAVGYTTEATNRDWLRSIRNPSNGLLATVISCMWVV